MFSRRKRKFSCIILAIAERNQRTFLTDCYIYYYIFSDAFLRFNITTSSINATIYPGRSIDALYLDGVRHLRMHFTHFEYHWTWRGKNPNEGYPSPLQLTEEIYVSTGTVFPPLINTVILLFSDFQRRTVIKYE